MTVAPADLSPVAGSDFYYACLYYPQAQRARLHVLEGMRRELTRIPLNCSDRGVAYIKLAWWREELANQPHQAARHPLTQILYTWPDRDTVLAVFARLVDAVDLSLDEAPAATENDVAARIARVHDGAANLLACCDDQPDPNELELVRQLASAVEQGYALRDLRQHRTSLAPLYLAENMLALHQLSTAGVREGASSARLHAVLTDHITRTRDALHTTLAAMGAALRRRQRLHVTLARIEACALQMTLDDGCHVLERRLELIPVHKLWLAWRTRRLG